ncbi:beta-L-arabinofuranosidase domain-containing protein [Actinomadura sp. NPDC048394]|uniref:beta-L-arabinofuranosidase domain-containing protein n=1 Tax=Actinomadura sp. NPDC048394 TaxID=3158223 RepID=UPI003406E398
MTGALDRRAFLGTAGAASAALALPALPAPPARAGTVRVSPKPVLAPFPLPDVTLLDGPFRANMTRTCNYLKFVDADRLLHTFRLNVGLPSSAQPCGGWEAPDVQLRGHSTGHLLSALAQAHANTGDDAYAAKGRYIVGELAKCQAASPSAGFGAGYLSAFEEAVFDQMEAGGHPWAPYYTLHKIMAGLLDQYRLSGNAQALTVLKGMAAWAGTRTGRLTTDQMQKVLGVEFGGMNDVLAELYQVTGDPEHLATARRFDHEAVFGPLAARTDALDGLHANTQIPKIVGAVREYEATGEARYHDIAAYFWDTVVHHHSYVIGGNSNNELFGPPGEIASRLGSDTCENCNSYNMLKLSRLLFLHDPSASAYMDHYEWTLLNQMLGEQDPDSEHGFVTYYTGLWPGSQREVKGGLKAAPGSYSSDYDNFSCDHGTGMETATKFADSIYFRSRDELFVNLFIPSEVTWRERGIGIRQETGYPHTDRTRLTVTSGSSHFTLKIRVPGWLGARGARARIRVNGAAVPVKARPGSYASIERHWKRGDVVDVAMPMAPVWRKAPDNPCVQAVSVGPVVLAGEYGDRALNAFPAIDPRSLRADRSAPLNYTASADGATVKLKPFSEVQHERYTVYWATPAPRRKPALLAHFPLTGRSLADATGRWPDASLVSGASWADDGGAVALDGTGGHVALPAGLLSGLDTLTVSVWLNLDTVANNTRVFDLGFNKTTYFAVIARTGSAKARFTMKITGMDGEDYADAPSALPAGAWTHLAVTAGSGSAVLYVDGVPAGRNDALVMSPLALGATTHNYLGRSQDTRNPAMDGQVTGFRLYNHVLTADEIASLHAQGRS